MKIIMGSAIFVGVDKVIVAVDVYFDTVNQSGGRHNIREVNVCGGNAIFIRVDAIFVGVNACGGECLYVIPLRKTYKNFRTFNKILLVLSTKKQKSFCSISF